MAKLRRIFAAVLVLAPATAWADPRPNVLWIMSEDISPDLGCYGDAYARTPNIDRLAAQGVRYTNVFSVSGVCAPSRSAVITGMYPTTIGTHHMRSHGLPPDGVKCFSEYLRSAGYYCTNNAKTDYNVHPEVFTNPAKAVTEAPIGAWDECGPRAHWRDRPEGAPFFAVFTIATSHEGRVRAPDDVFERLTARLRPEDRHDPNKAVLPPYYPDAPESRRDWARYHDLITAMDLETGDLLRQLEEDGLADTTVVFFFGDNGRGLPRAKRWVYDSGIRVPLIIRWPGRLEPGLVNEELISFIDFAPTALSIAGVGVPAHMQGRAILGDARTPAPEYVFAARDRMDETQDVIRAVRDARFKYIRNFEPEKPYAQLIAYMDEMPTMKVWRQWAAEGRLAGPQKLFFQPAKPEEELYDTQNDPHEINNLAPLPHYHGMLERMRAVLVQWMRDTNDLGLLPEAEYQERIRPGGVWRRTATPEVRLNAERLVEITCATDGASIVYTTEPGNAAHWRLYTVPFPYDPGQTLRVKAGRMGYLDSSEVTYK